MVTLLDSAPLAPARAKKPLFEFLIDESLIRASIEYLRLGSEIVP